MKIGIITFQNAVNYGAVLQTYALQHTIEKSGGNSEIINYQCKKINYMYDPFPQTTNIRKVLSNIIWYKKKKKKKLAFENFEKKYLKVTDKKYYNKENLEETNAMFDIFISGSDQVWRAESTDFDTTYFLDFVKDNNKKYSYAASFGSDKIEDKYIEKYRHLLKGYKELSVREEQGQVIIENLLHRESRVDLDPTFLVDKDEWKKIEKKPEEKEKYIILFIIRKSEKIFRFAENLAKEKGYKLIYISNDRKKDVDATYIGGISPEEWLGYIDNAEYIVTNSFHGVAFSIIFNKKFFLELQPYPAKANSRLENIMDMFSLRNREILNGKNDYINEEIDYKSVEKLIQDRRSLSIEYLEKIIQGDKR